MVRVHSNHNKRSLVPIVGSVFFIASLVILTVSTIKMRSFTVHKELGHHSSKHRNSSVDILGFDRKKITKGDDDEDDDSDEETVAAPYDPNRLCTQNQYVKSLNMSLSEYAVSMDTWMDNKVDIERVQTQL